MAVVREEDMVETTKRLESLEAQIEKLIEPHKGDIKELIIRGKHVKGKGWVCRPQIVLKAK